MNLSELGYMEPSYVGTVRLANFYSVILSPYMFGWTVVQSFRRAKMTNGNRLKEIFFQCRVPSYGPFESNFDTLNTKGLEKIISGGLFMTPPPKIHYSALQCTAMYCSVNT